MAKKVSSDEVISGEEMLSYVDSLADEVEKGDDIPEGLCIGSLDVVSLYPSLDIPKCAKICREQILKSDPNFDGIDLKWATMYVAMTNTQLQINQKGIQDIIPGRRHKNGERPGIRGAIDDPEGERWRWFKSISKYTEDDTRKVMAHVTESLVLATFKDHFYRWDGQTRRHTKRGAMGLRAYGSLSRVCMDSWMEEFKAILKGL